MSKFCSRWCDGFCKRGYRLYYYRRSSDGASTKRRKGRSLRMGDESPFQSPLGMQVSSTRCCRILAKAVLPCMLRSTELSNMLPRDHRPSVIPAGWEHDGGWRMKDGGRRTLHSVHGPINLPRVYGMQVYRLHLSVIAVPQHVALLQVNLRICTHGAPDG